MPKVRVQSQICYPLSMPTYTVNVFNEIVPEMSVEVQSSTTVAKWMHVLLDWRRGRGVTSYARSALLVWLLGFHRPLNFTHPVPSDALVTGMGFQQRITSYFNSFKTGVHSWLVCSNLQVKFGTVSVGENDILRSKKKKKNLTMTVGLPQDHPSRASPQDVVT